jgi:CHAT domain-containing protein
MRASAPTLALLLFLTTAFMASAQPLLEQPDPALVERAEDEDVEALWLLGHFYAERGAEGDLERALELMSTVPERALIYFDAESEQMLLLHSTLASVATRAGDHETALSARRQVAAILATIDRVSRRRGHALEQVAESLRQLGRHEEAIEEVLAARRVHAAVGAESLIDRGDTWNDEGVSLVELGDHAAGIERYRNAVSIYRRAGDEASQRLLTTLSNLVLAAAVLERHEERLAAMQERFAILRAQDSEPELLADEATKFARALRDADRLDEALSVLDEAVPASRATRNDYRATSSQAIRRLATLQWERGLTLYALGRLEDTAAAYKAAAALIETLPDPVAEDLAGLLGNMVALAVEMQDEPAHAEAMDRYIAFARDYGIDNEYRVGILTDRADQLRAAERYDEAIPLYRELVELVERAGFDRPLDVSYALVAEGIGWFHKKEYQNALDVYTRALDIQKAAGAGHEDIVISLANMAQLNHLLTQYGVSERARLEQISVLEEFDPGSEALGVALVDLAVTYQKLARHQEAIDRLQEARELYLALYGPDHALVGDTYLTEGISREGLGDLDAALDLYARARRIYAAEFGQRSAEVAYTLNNTAWIYRLQERHAESDTLFREATAIMEGTLGPTHQNTSIGYINIGITSHLLGNYLESVQWGMRAMANLHLDPETTLDHQRWNYDSLSKAFRGLGDNRRAIMFGKLAVNAQQRIRSFNTEYSDEQLHGFREEWRHLYQDLADLLIAEGRFSEAQAVLNMEKEEELVDFVLRDATADLRGSQSILTHGEESFQDTIDDLLARPVAAANALARLDARLAAGTLSEAEVQTRTLLEEALDEAYADFMDRVDDFLAEAADEDYDVRREVDAINLDYTADHQETLRDLEGRAVMLQVAALANATHLFLTAADASIHRQVEIERTELSRLVFEALSAIEARAPDANARLQALHTILVAPVAEELAASGADTIMLNLQGFLRYVPFAALFDGERHLVEDYALAIFTPAARTRYEAADRLPERSAGFGVTGSHPGFSPLPGVAREIEAIFGLRDNAGALAGKASLDHDFTRDTFRDALGARPAVVHIASHFHLVPGRETDSYLLLGDGSSLSLADIRRGRGFRFGGVDLLTLSACQTARGGDSDGGEVESFGALAQMNGASAVLATLWPVADDATAELMGRFYSHFVAEGMDKAAHMAKIKVAIPSSNSMATR